MSSIHFHLTDRAREVLGLARKSANDRQLNSITSIDLILSLISEKTGIPAQLIKSVGADHLIEKGANAAVRNRDQSACIEWSSSRDVDVSQFDEQMKMIWHQCQKAASSTIKIRNKGILKSDQLAPYVGSEHLLLGIIESPSDANTILGDALEEVGVTISDLRSRVLSVMGCENP